MNDWAVLPVLAADVERPAISPEVSDYLRASLSDNSRRAYRSDLNHFLAWGGTIPASPEMVAQYLASHAGQHAIATLARRVVSIGKAHTTQGMPSPTDTELVRATLRGIRHTHGSAQRQVAPAVKEDVLAMVANLEGVKGIRDKALLLIGFAGAFRRSELVSLTVADIEQAKQGLIVHLRRSKTDQDGLSACRRHPDFVQVGFGPGLQGFRQRVEDVAGLVHPAALARRFRVDLVERGPEAQCTIADGQARSEGQPTIDQITQDVQPRFLRFAQTVANRHQFFPAIGHDTDNYQ